MCGCKNKHKTKMKPKRKPKKKPKVKPKKRRSLVAGGCHICRRKKTKQVIKPRKKKLYLRRNRRGKGWDDDDYLANMPVKGGLYPKKTTDSKYNFLK